MNSLLTGPVDFVQHCQSLICCTLNQGLVSPDPDLLYRYSKSGSGLTRSRFPVQRAVHHAVQQIRIVEFRSKFVSMAFTSWKEVMQYMIMVVRYNTVEERFISFIKLFSD